MLEPIKVIIHDFPKFISEFLDFETFAIDIKSKANIYLNVHKTEIKPFSLKNILKSDHIITWLRAKSNPKISIKNKSLTKINQMATFNIKEAFDVKSVKGKVNTVQIAKGNIELKNKLYLDVNRYAMGTAYKLGYWDSAIKNLASADGTIMDEISAFELGYLNDYSNKLLDVDNLTVDNMSILRVDE